MATSTLPVHIATRSRAAALDALADAEGVKLPAEVRKAIDRCRVLADFRLPPVPERLVAEAVNEAAWEIVGADGNRVAIDTSGLTAARLAEAEAQDRATVLVAAKGAADLHLCEVVERNRAAVLASLQSRYGDVAEIFVAAVRHLPEGLTEKLALRLPEEIRQAWLDKEDSAVELLRLRDLVSLVADYRERQVPTPDVLAALWIRSDLLWRQRTPRGLSEYPFGDPGSESFMEYLGRHADASQWWSPTLAEAREYVRQAGWGSEQVSTRTG
jgi:hypothetical protein